MLTSINIQLEALNNTSFTTDSALGIHGLFFKLLQGVDPLLSEELHNLDQLKPYTLSSLKEYNKGHRTQKITAGQLYDFRVTILKDIIFKAFYEGLYSYFTKNTLLKIGGGDFKIINYNVEATTNFEEIVQNSKQANKYKMEFKSPTSFRRLGKNHLFPDPETLFKSYVDKWNTFASEENSITEEEREALQQHTFTSQYELKTELMEMNRYKIVGFRGSCMIQIDKKAPQENIEIFNRLLAFVPYSGTGYKTTMGMGQTEVAKQV